MLKRRHSELMDHITCKQQESLSGLSSSLLGESLWTETWFGNVFQSHLVWQCVGYVISMGNLIWVRFFILKFGFFSESGPTKVNELINMNVAQRFFCSITFYKKLHLYRSLSGKCFVFVVMIMVSTYWLYIHLFHLTLNNKTRATMFQLDSSFLTFPSQHFPFRNINLSDEQHANRLNSTIIWITFISVQ